MTPHMPSLATSFAGIRSPNPFWLASGPPTNSLGQALRAFEAGWGGVVWKTIGEPIVNTVSRYGGLDYGQTKLIGLNNIELISDRPIEVNLRELAEAKRRYPDRAVIASLMVESRRETWHEMVRRAEDAGCDGLELNFGCPHGMSERGMGSSVGQVPEYTEMITTWVKEAARTPVIVKLTPNITDITRVALAAERGGADGLALINTINSVIGVNLDTLAPLPTVAGLATHGGYCGPAVKPIALHMLAACAQQIRLPLSGIGGIANWRDAAEFIALGASSLQVCTAVMHYGFRIVEDLIEGLENYLAEKKMGSLDELRGQAAPKVTDWGQLDLNYRIVARIHPERCIGCHLCYIACEDGAHQCIEPNLGPGMTVQTAGAGAAAAHGSRFVSYPPGLRVPQVREEDCVGCNLCALVCPVPECIVMEEIPTGHPAENWNQRQERLRAEAGH